MKADICHALMNRTFAATAGANNVSKLMSCLRSSKERHGEEIIEAQDMDKYRNVHVEKGASKIYLMARKHGWQCRRLTWNPNYKGFDDWQLALREECCKGIENNDVPGAVSVWRMRVFLEIDACVKRWHKTQPDGVPSQAYPACWTKNHAFLQPGGNARLAELLNAQWQIGFRRILPAGIYGHGEKQKPFAFSGIDAPTR